LDIVLLNDFAHVNGGAAQVALSEAIGLAKRGHRLDFLAAVGPVAPELAASSAHVTLTHQFDIKSDPNRLRAASQGLWNPRAARELARLLSDRRPDKTIVHVHGWCKALSSSVIRQSLRMGFPLVMTLHDYFYTCPNGGFFNSPKKTVCHLKPLSVACLCENCDRDGYPQKLWRSLRQGVQNGLGAFRDVRHFITLSDFSEDILRPALPANGKLYRVPNPIDVQRQPPVEVGRNTRFLAVGRMSAEKGLSLLAQAAAEMGADLTVVGDGPSRDEILAINPKTEVTGWSTREQVEEWFGRARALVFPSLWYEAQPLVVGEAAARGIPAIVPDQCAAREWVVDGVTGLWFHSGSVADLKAKMTILQDADTAARMGRAAYRRYWQAPFTLDKHLDTLDSTYRAVFADAGTGMQYSPQPETDGWEEIPHQAS
jgi:glycosyltransferase involved in cell wall biosynthesis